MSEISFWSMAKGKLTHLSYIFCKPDPLGTEFKTVACSVTGALISIEVHNVNGRMNQNKYQKHLGENVACTKIIIEATKGIGQRYIKGDKKDF